MTAKLKILHLYARDMNIYGDNGNILAITHRAKQYGIGTEVIAYNPGDKLPDNIDIIIGGGGQDSGQSKVVDDLQAIGSRLKKLAEANVPMLMVCGLYQLFGHKFITSDGTEIPGISLLDITTTAGPERLIGNLSVDSAQFGELIGYENHSGQTFLGDRVKPLGNVIRGAGNNNHDGYEGARYKNVIGTYLHGPLLPKNPEITDYLLFAALANKGTVLPDVAIDDSIANLARKYAFGRPR